MKLEFDIKSFFCTCILHACYLQLIAKHLCLFASIIVEFSWPTLTFSYFTNESHKDKKARCLRANMKMCYIASIRSRILVLSILSKVPVVNVDFLENLLSHKHFPTSVIVFWSKSCIICNKTFNAMNLINPLATGTGWALYKAYGDFFNLVVNGLSARI